MAGTKLKVLQKGTTIRGKFGTYIIKEKLGRGGNGEVFEVDIKNSNIGLAKCDSYAIKILNLEEIRTEKEREKRYERFQDEIRSVRDVQYDIEGIIPVFDASFDMDVKVEFDWYLMPKASEYRFRNSSLKTILQDMRQLAYTIDELHKRNYMHRDIKPDNLLWYKGRIYLSDFGLVWNPWKNSLTTSKDKMGPIAIRPPELDEVDDTKEVDYTKSDVYLFAKTMWIILTGRRQGFTGEYRRDEKQIYLDKKLFHVCTLEPIHIMLEMATKHFFMDRINIEDCILLIEEQLSVIYENIDPKRLNVLKFREAAQHSFVTVNSDSNVYTNPQNILPLLESMITVSEIVFDEYGRHYSAGELYKHHFTTY